MQPWVPPLAPTPVPTPPGWSLVTPITTRRPIPRPVVLQPLGTVVGSRVPCLVGGPGLQGVGHQDLTGCGVRPPVPPRARGSGCRCRGHTGHRGGPQGTRRHRRALLQRRRPAAVHVGGQGVHTHVHQGPAGGRERGWVPHSGTTRCSKAAAQAWPGHGSCIAAGSEGGQGRRGGLQGGCCLTTGGRCPQSTGVPVGTRVQGSAAGWAEHHRVPDSHGAVWTTAVLTPHILAAAMQGGCKRGRHPVVVRGTSISTALAPRSTTITRHRRCTSTSTSTGPATSSHTTTPATSSV